jgi:hypothetical protein
VLCHTRELPASSLVVAGGGLAGGRLAMVAFGWLVGSYWAGSLPLTPTAAA